MEAAFDIADLEALVPTDLKKQYDIREVIARHAFAPTANGGTILGFT